MCRNRGIIWHMLNRTIFIKHNAVVILDTGVFLVGHFDLAISERIDLILLQLHIILVCLFIKEGSLNLSTIFIYQLDIEQTAGAALIAPRFFLVFLGHTRLNFPIEQKSVQRFDRRMILLNVVE